MHCRTVMYALFSILVALVAFADAQISSVGTPTGPTGAMSAIQCEVYPIAWAGGTGPFNVRLLDSAQNLVEYIARGVTSGPVLWTANQPVGDIFNFAVQDSTGSSAVSGQFAVATSSNSSCLSASSLPASVSSTASSATSSTGSTASSAPSLPTSISSASSSSSKALPAGAIAGIVVGAVFAVSLVLVGVVWAMRRRSRRALAMSDAENEAVTSVLADVEPYPSPRMRIEQLRSSGTGISFPASWERKASQNDGPHMPTERASLSALEGTVSPAIPRTDPSAETAPTVEISETNLDRLVNQLLRRMQAQEAPPSYPANDA